MQLTIILQVVFSLNSTPSLSTKTSKSCKIRFGKWSDYGVPRPAIGYRTQHVTFIFQYSLSSVLWLTKTFLTTIVLRSSQFVDDIKYEFSIWTRIPKFKNVLIRKLLNATIPANIPFHVLHFIPELIQLLFESGYIAYTQF